MGSYYSASVDSKPVDMPGEESSPAPGPLNGSNNGEKEDGGILPSPNSWWNFFKQRTGAPSTGLNKDEEASRSNITAVVTDIVSSGVSSLTGICNSVKSFFNTSGDSPQGDTCAEPTNTEESGGRANSEDPGSSNREVAIQESDSSGSTEASKSIKARLEDVYHGVAEYVNPTPKTKINIKAGKGSYIVASQSTIDNADIRTESKSGENHIIAFSGPGQYTHTRAHGRIEKKAGGEFKNFPNAVKGNENSDTKQLPGSETGEAKP